MRVAIIFSGHLRNILEHTKNLKDNFLSILEINDIEYDIYIHTWDNNHTSDTNLNHDKFFKISNINYILKKLKKRLPKIKLVKKEKQEKVDHLWITRGKFIHGKVDTEYIHDIYNKLYFQFMGIKRVLNICKESGIKYDYVVRTRPDCYYKQKFDVKLLNNDFVVPFSHQKRGISINQIFFMGKYDTMDEVCDYITRVEVMDQKYILSDINLNNIFRKYILDYLKIKPLFCDFNPSLYRDKDNIQDIH